MPWLLSAPAFGPSPCLLLSLILPPLGRPSRRYKKHAGLDCYPPLQIMFTTKTSNRGKLDSHCWFFDGFAYLLQPDFCVLFDAGGWAGPHPAHAAVAPACWLAGLCWFLGTCRWRK